MSNKYNAWVPTQNTPLPVDYYQSALMLNEQRTGESLDKINAIISAYGQIQPISADAQALYDETIDELKAGIEEVAKSNLKTPEAKRRTNQLINDPKIVGNLDKVYMDAVYAAQARKDLNEYLKKNPEVNAVDYVQAFNRLGLEKGDSKAFNPNRFKNMPALTDYVDINQKVADEVSKLKANEQEVERITGNKVIKMKEAGVYEDRIRELAMSRVMNDPQLKAQFDRNVRYGGFLTNPYDMDEGKVQVAGMYRNNMQERLAQAEAEWTEATAGKTEEEIKGDKKLAQGKLILERIRKDAARMLSLDDDSLVSNVAFEGFAHSFDPYANKQTAYGEKWDPLYLQNLREARADARMWTRINAQKKQLEDIFSAKPLTVPGIRQQGDISPTNWGSYIRDRVPELKGVVLDENGAFTPENYKSQLVKGPDGKYYLPEDVMEVGHKQDKPDNSVWERRYKYPMHPRQGGGDEIWVKKGATPIDKSNYKEAYDKGVNQLRTYLKRITPSGDLSRYNDLKSEEGIKTAIQDVVGFNQSFEATYGTGYQLPASNTNSFRASVADVVSKTGVRDTNGKYIPPEEAKKLAGIIEGLRKSNSNITPVFKIYDRHWDTPVYEFNVDGKTYTVPMHQEYQGILGSMQSTLSSIVKGKAGVLSQGNDLIITGLEGGQQINAVFEGANTPQYQSVVKKMFDDNVKKLMGIGFSEAEAKSKLRTTAAQAAEYMKSGDAFPIEKGGKKVYIDNAVGFYLNPNARRPQPKYYSFTQVGDLQVKSLGQSMYDKMTEFGSTSNPYMSIPNLDLMRSRTLLGILGNMGEGGGDDYIPEIP